MIARIVLFAVAALAGGAAIGRNVVNRRVEDQLPQEIKIARAAAVEELEKEISAVIVEKLIALALNLSAKAGLIGAIYLLFTFGLLSVVGFRIIVFALIALFLLRDALSTLPYMAPAWRLARRHSFNMRVALKEFVAGVAFERAYAQAMTAMETGPKRFWLAFSKYTAHSLSTEVAEAVADVARTARYRRVKQRAVLGAILAGVMIAAYALFFVITVGAT